MLHSLLGLFWNNEIFSINIVSIGKVVIFGEMIDSLVYLEIAMRI